ncbi:sigma-54-dependent Fis family transcriptional regulator [Azospirillum picis]|uniref:Transcriptional regulator of acetoin/glycerol metabolism n=1 Tax=Azospirillum picis TaxID=488438 RepID=A0ABU0MJL0_9PROT|nr:sigma-54-dependent Fis family transcriptional regulator [Azospirillum picis]MBP2299472.1 transcriptional regulator of acetoin/glycerol metabolism [Azospirillum picis]MDQ0533401.1 transcriptional regulator of acetoin/glycerol metabolism [Azospirillum picis]
MDSARAAHIDELVRVSAGVPSRRDSIIESSWRRCVADHKLDPTIGREPHILPQERLRVHRDAMDEFLRMARFGLEALYRQVAGMGYVMLLTDSNGVTVDFIGDPTFDNHLRRAGLYLGSDWNEEHAGTCAVGTCIATGQSLTVHQTDHFDSTHIPLTCTAAPVFDSGGELAAVLDISALHSPEPKISQYLALQMVKAYVHKIETANLYNNFRREWVVKLAASQEFAEVDPDFVLALDGGGRIIGFNHRAHELLAEDGVSPLGRSFAELFDCEVADLVHFVRSLPTDQRTLHLRRNGRPLFAQAMPPPAVALPRSHGTEPADTAPPLPEPLRAVSGGDPALKAVLARAAKLVNTRVSLLIHGETGTGKEHLAKALHRASIRRGKPFVAVNCAALPENLIESELFGYEPGAFTGATSRGKKGLILEADGGTLFLDEIGDMPLPSQTRLLRVLAEREVTPIGRTRAVSVDVRVIGATHRDLIELVKAGKFRDDLYFRLNGAVFTVPPLRQRGDLDWLIERLVADRAERDGIGYRLTPAALAALRAHRWPGNVRELVNALDYACAVSDGGLIDLADIPEPVQRSGLFQAWPEPPEEAIQEAEQDPAVRLRETLRRHHWNVSATARAMGVDRSTVHRQMHRFGIVAPHRAE